MNRTPESIELDNVRKILRDALCEAHELSAVNLALMAAQRMDELSLELHEYRLVDPRRRSQDQNAFFQGRHSVTFSRPKVSAARSADLNRI